MIPSCIVLPHEAADGPSNMALDEALLDFVALNPTSAALRTYEWTAPTLSLGYFQSYREIEADPRWAGVPIVRRPTGGGALWHDREITYAAVVPGDHPAARPSRELYRIIHAAIVEELRSLGITAGRRGDGPPGEFSAGRPFLCFTGRDSEDIIVNGSKLVGSAQRRRSGAVLQHGSLLLGRSARTPELPGLSDLASVATDAPAWSERLRSVLPRALGLRPVTDRPPTEVSRRAEALVSGRYADRSWTRRR